MGNIKNSLKITLLFFYKIFLKIIHKSITLGHPLIFQRVKSTDPKLEVITIRFTHPKNINISRAWSGVIILLKRISSDI